jgi:hypothetical protein
VCVYIETVIKQVIRGYIQTFPDWVDNKLYAYNNKPSLKSNTKDYGVKTHYIDSQNSNINAPSIESYTICSSRSRQPVRKLLDTPLYITTIKNNFDISTSGTKFRIETFRKSRSDNPFGERRSFIQFEGDNDVI